MSKQAVPDVITNDDVKEIKHFYDNVYHANAEGEHADFSSHYSALYRRLGIQQGSRVLDVACGTGGWLQICHDSGCEVSGVDISDRAIDLCRERLPSGAFHAQPAETLPFEENSFNLVSCLGSLEHFIDPLACLMEMRRVAKPDALLVILVPNKDFLTRKLGLFGGTYQVDAKEVVRTLPEWQALFHAAGLNVQERWRDLHVLNRHWIMRGSKASWPLRFAQAAALPFWPLKWQYQVYHRCSIQSHGGD
ncbi:MAG: methyltransferase domain-containing protein [Halioglobus sp.]